MNNIEYKKLVKKFSPKESILKNAYLAFLSGGILGVISTVIYTLFLNVFDSQTSLTITILIIIILSSLLTALSVFDDLVSKFKCGIIIPISGFAHSMTSAAIDYKKDGFITGIGANTFKLAGSVIVYGVVSAFIFSIIRVIING